MTYDYSPSHLNRSCLFTWALCCYALPMMMMMMTKKTREGGGGGGKGLNFKTMFFSKMYVIQIVQNITQLSSKGRFNHPPLFLIHWIFESN